MANNYTVYTTEYSQNLIQSVCSRRTAYIVRDNAKKITLVGLSYKDVILFPKIFYVFGVVYVKSNRISCEFSGLNIVATL